MTSKRKTTSVEDIYQHYEKALLKDLESSITNPEEEFLIEPYDLGCCIVSYNGDSDSVIIPESIADMPVLSVKAKAFYRHKKVKQVTLPEGLIHIGEDAFCAGKISQINIPSTVLTIDRGAFSYSKIKDICFPESVKSIPDWCCSCCESLKTVVILGANTIGWRAFSHCDRLEKVALPNTLEELGRSAFSWCGKLKFLIVPKSVKRICVQSGGLDEETDIVSLNMAVLNDHVEWLDAEAGKHEGYFLCNLFSNKGSSTDVISKLAIGDHGDLSDFSQMIKSVQEKKLRTKRK